MSFNHANDRFYPFVRNRAKVENWRLVTSFFEESDHAGGANP
ncbi:hypothetical protein [Pseudomonas putida]|nr:hypothetical protein [Pseudomonas putida]